MIYIAGKSLVSADYILRRNNISMTLVRIITTPRQLVGLTGGNLYTLPQFFLNENRDDITHAAEDRLMRLVEISDDISYAELLELEKVGNEEV